MLPANFIECAAEVLVEAVRLYSYLEVPLNNVKGKAIPKKKCKLYYALDACFKDCQKNLADVEDFRNLLDAIPSLTSTAWSSSPSA